MKWLPYDLEEEILSLDPKAGVTVDLIINKLCHNEELFDLTLSNKEDEKLLGDEYIPIYSPRTTFKNVKIARNLFHKSGTPLIDKALQNILKQVKGK